MTQREALARAWRPASFKDLIGQDILVETFTREIETGRVKHAYLLTGVRGIGKTTSARIIARGLNCENGPTADPCGTCAQCEAIGSERHMDVIEMDAASHTGVDDMRQLIDNVPYKPVQGRTKVYIIDEVHMLSKAAFNALLKTLEEPPAHAVFILATTELNKVPATVISRCERFDLKRVPPDTLGKHLIHVAEKEGFALDEDAAVLLAHAGEGSVRDGMSLLDRAISLEGDRITSEACRNMIGLADRSLVLDLFKSMLTGDAAQSIGQVRHLVEAGADPLMLTADIMAAAHLTAALAAAPELAKDPSLSPNEATKGTALAKEAGYARAAGAWQILSRSLDEIKSAPDALVALEMAVLRTTTANSRKG